MGYTAGPAPLKYLGLGDLAVLICFGPGMIAYSSSLLVGTVPVAAVVLALPAALYVVAILHANNYRDIESDKQVFFFFCCIAERAIKPCRSSRSKLRGEFGIPRHLQNRNQKHNKATNKQNTKQTKDKNRQVLECETRGEKRVKRPKRPNALICRTPGGSMRYP